MKHLFSILFISLVICTCNKENTIILQEVDDVCTMMDDLKFMSFCYNKFDVNHDSKVSMSEAAAVKSINIESKNLTSLKGIEYFTGLTELKCDNNQLTTLDVSHNIQLQSLRCKRNQIASLIVSGTPLTYIDCSDNQLTNLEISKCSQLERLNCERNKISALNISKNQQMTTLDCSFNSLNSLNLSKNPQLMYLGCTNNILQSLDFTGLPNLIRYSSLPITHCWGYQDNNAYITITDKQEYWSELPSESISNTQRIKWDWE